MKSRPEKIENIKKTGKGDKIPFSAKKAARRGLISCGLLAGALALFTAAIVLSFYSQGQGGRLVGVLGLVSFAAAACGCVYGFSGFREEDRRYGACTAGAIGNGLVLLVELSLCLLGM
ncbi:MAG: DUF6142 family protein [Lachnospira sp.]|nr:DUF6142 family protein [Lachnospira sp.]